MSSDKASKTEKATPKKVSDARKKGQVARSQEVSAWTTTLVMSLLVPLTVTRTREHVDGLWAELPDLIAAHETAPAIALFGEGLQDRLADPPHSIGDEFEALRFVEALGSLDEAEVALVDEVAQRKTLVLVLLGYRNHET